jgi:hypothetical protein
MLTRVLIVIFAVATFFLFTFNYYRNNVNPYNAEAIQKIIEENQIEEDQPERLEAELQTLRNRGVITDYLSNDYFIGVFFLTLSIALYTSMFHLFFEKLFFKKYYESPSYFDGFRRGILAGLTVYIVQVLRLSKVDFWTIVGVAVIITLLEIAFAVYIKKDLIKLINNRKKA